MAYLGVETSAHTPIRRQVLESFGTVEPICEAITGGCGLFIVNRGQWTMLDVILALTRSHGGADISLWTWTVSPGASPLVTPLLQEPLMSAARLVLHAGALKGNAELVAAWQTRYGAASVSAMPTHAKIARVATADGLLVLIRGSMSLNFTPRIEQCDITEGGEDYRLVERLEAALPVVPVAERAMPSRASASALSLLTGVRSWIP